MTISNNSTLSELQNHLILHRDKGVRCPCCHRFVKIYKRKIYPGMAWFLIWLVRAYEQNKNIGAYIDVLLGPHQRSRDYGKLIYWKLAERKAVVSGEDQRTSRFWRPTIKGIDFAHDSIRVPRYAFILNNGVVGYSEMDISIRDCLGKNFSYEELMK